MLSKINQKVFISLIALAPFGIFLFRPLDPWHGMGMYIQLAILILFALSLNNKPLGALTIYLGLLTALVWGLTLLRHQQYAIKIFLPYFNFLCFVILYKLIQDNVDRNTIICLFKWLSNSLLLLLGYCVLQVLSLDPFFKDASISNNPDQLVGTIGNPGHLGALLAIIQPFFFNNKLALILLWILLILTHSASGVVVGIIVLLFYLWHKRNYYFYTLLSISSIAGIIALYLHREFFTFSSRLWVWQKTWELFQTGKSQIIGLGLGSFNLLNLNQGATKRWGHLHQEYLQILFEAGIIGLCLVIWCIYDYFKTFREKRDDLTIKIASIFLGFCLLGLFSFPAHLWLISLFGVLSYSLLYAIKEKNQ